MGWWQRAPWGDKRRVGVRLAWANAFVAVLAVLYLLLDSAF